MVTSKLLYLFDEKFNIKNPFEGEHLSSFAESEEYYFVGSLDDILIIDKNSLKN